VVTVFVKKINLIPKDGKHRPINRRIVIFLVAGVLIAVILSVTLFDSYSTTRLFETAGPITTSTAVVTSNIPVTQTLTSYSTSTLTEVSQDTLTSTISVTSTQTERVTVSPTILQNSFRAVNNSILVGGQDGAWFTPTQYPTLSIISLNDFSSATLAPISTDQAKGTVWGGAWNGTEWFVSGWGGYENASDSALSQNPYLDLYDQNGTLLGTSGVNMTEENEWNGGDIFAASSNGSTWLLSGMGSGVLGSYSPIKTNHFSAGLFNGSNFVDLSSELPRQMDGILYANAYGNGGWMVGGGWKYKGVLFWFNGSSFTDLTSEIASAIPTFHSVTSVAWNGNYWLVGGVGFLAKYNGSSFVDLTAKLDSSLNDSKVELSNSTLNSVNSIVWNGSEWLIGGGLAKSYVGGASYAWLASSDNSSSAFQDLTPLLPAYAHFPSSNLSSVVSIAYLPGRETWVVGGYSNGRGLLLEINDAGVAQDISGLVDDMSYVNWVGATS